MKNFKLLKFISSDTGSRKTQSVIKKANSTEQGRFIIVQNTKALVLQTAEQIPSSHHILDGLNSTSVFSDLHQFLLNPTHRVLCITDKAFLSVQDISLLQGWSIYIDDVVGFHEFSTESDVSVQMKIVLRDLVFEQFDVLGENQGTQYITCKKRDNIKDTITQKVARGFKIIDQNDQFIMNGNFFTEVLVVDPNTGHKTLVPNNEVNKLAIYAWKDLNKYIGLDITFMAAYFEDTLVYKAHSHLFEEVTIEGLIHRTVPVSERLKVFYFSKKRVMSKALRRSYPEQVQKVIQYLNETITMPFYYTANKEFVQKNGKFMPKGKFVSTEVRGLNSLMTMPCCVWLASMKPDSIESKQCELFFGITNDEIVKAREFQTLYQWVTRGISRSYENTDVQIVYVWDEQQALSLTDNIEYIDLGLDLGEPREPVHMTGTVRTRYSRIGSSKKIKKIEDFKEWLGKSTNQDLSNLERELFMQKFIDVMRVNGIK